MSVFVQVHVQEAPAKHGRCDGNEAHAYTGALASLPLDPGRKHVQVYVSAQFLWKQAKLVSPTGTLTKK